MNVYIHNNVQGILVSSAVDDTSIAQKELIYFYPITRVDIMDKVSSGQLKSVLSYVDIHDYNNTYQGITDIYVDVVMDRITGTHIIPAWVTPGYVKKDKINRELYILTDSSIHNWVSKRRLYVDKIISTLLSTPVSTNCHNQLQAIKQEWIVDIKELKGNPNDTQLDFKSIMNDVRNLLPDNKFNIDVTLYTN